MLGRWLVALGVAVELTAFAVACGSASDRSDFGGDGDDGGASGDGSFTSDGGGGTIVGDPGGGDGGGDGASTPCVNLQCQQVACANGGHTTVSGVVLDPAGKNPLPNVAVYVPNAKPQPFVDHATCDACDALYTGDPIAAALTDPTGHFTVDDVPVGNDIPLVIQVGKWRRQITIPSVAACVDTKLTNSTATPLRLPASRAEGDIPKIAISTGGADSMECLFRRMGVAASEFTSTDADAARIHVFQGESNESVVKRYAAQTSGGSPKSAASLWASEADLAKYDIVVLSCEGDEFAGDKPQAALDALETYANQGGRIFASHYHYYWFNHGSPAWNAVSPTWYPSGSGDPSYDDNIDSLNATIDTGFDKGKVLKEWLSNLTPEPLNADGTVPILVARANAAAPAVTDGGASRAWLTANVDPSTAGAFTSAQYLVFNTPIGAGDTAQCGRVAFSDLHVGGGARDYATTPKDGTPTVPDGCADNALSPQERVLEFLLFDLSACVTPDTLPPAPPSVPPPPIR